MLNQRGDTLVEVMLAFAIFATVGVGTIGVMNRGISIAERSIEITSVRQQIDAQAELLRYASQEKGATWQSILANLDPTPAIVDDYRSACPTSAPADSFILAANSAGAEVRYHALGSNFSQATLSSRFDFDSTTPTANGIWVVATEVSDNLPNTASAAYDMHIGACWDTVASDQPQILGTIVRLYDYT